MGLPVEFPSPRGQRADEGSETSSSGGEDEGWVQESGSDDDGAGSWADPSGGVLSQVFDAAEAGDASALADLLQGLDVSIDTRVRWAASGGGAADGCWQEPPLPGAAVLLRHCCCSHRQWRAG